MAARAAKPPRLYFNLRSPYSFFALRDMERDCPEILDRLEWHPFWEPDGTSEKLLAEALPGAAFPYQAMTRAKQFYILRDVRRLGAERGLRLTWPLDRDVWWEPAHLAWFVAERAGLGRVWVERAQRARWLEGRDICDPAVVRELAEEIGLDGEEVAGATDDTLIREQAAQALVDVVRDGVFGVPYFINGSEPYWGLDRVSAFVASLPAAPEPVAREPEPAALVPGRATDIGHAGGCG
ncbi:2-hydroxychromene-2-carboxylate isomerase [Streptomyces liangshanensis]|uniref:2-hydroxychromene-2-carboxylate isomerase n=1 Tax=Streptomyces liangshanensis TaxID=2717324 RepID=A0A6G9H1P0_9ACTN|nr:DsbA family protein [Streptomyces liangshanensis]QIQ04380.1 2-hydroxychromene-2-carboxylate isomerase [Streptomyces liangshanensis]